MNTYKNFELWEASFDLPVPHQDGRFAIQKEPHAEATGRFFRIQWQDSNRLQRWRGESEEELC